MSTELYSYSYTVYSHFLFKQRQFNIGILFIEGRDILHFGDFWGFRLHCLLALSWTFQCIIRKCSLQVRCTVFVWCEFPIVEKITYYKVNTERNQKMLFSKNNWVFKRKKNVHPHCLSHRPPEPPSFSLYTTFKVKL